MNRKITLAKTFTIARKLKQLDIKERIKLTLSEVDAQKMTNTEVGSLIMMDLLNALLEEKGEQVLMEILTLLLEKDITNLGIDEIISEMFELAEENDLANFFSYVSKMILGAK